LGIEKQKLMKRILNYCWYFIAGLFAYVVYLWYRAAMFIVITEPVYTIEDWIKPHRKEKQEYWTMIIFAVSALSMVFFELWQIVIAYLVLSILNIIVYAIWKQIKERV
jgi:hypothetical protein